MKTVAVKFTESDNEKTYFFNMYECSNGVQLKEGLTIRLPNYYNQKVKVVKVLEKSYACLFTENVVKEVKTTQWLPLKEEGDLDPRKYQVSLNSKQTSRFSTLLKLQRIANYYNKGWQKKHNEQGFFLYHDPCNRWAILNHFQVVYESYRECESSL